LKAEADAYRKRELSTALTRYLALI